MLTSVICPVYGQLPLVLKLGTSLLQHRQKHLRDVFLMDDASKEFNLTELMGPPFNIVRNEKNLGFVANENKGASLAQGKYLFFLNSDIQVHPQWLDPAVELMEANPQIGVVGIKLVFPPQKVVHLSNEGPQTETDEITIQSCGGLYDAGHLPFHRYLGWLASDPRVNKTEKVSWVTGAAMLTPKAVFDKVGGFDPQYGRGYFDDPDYCEKVKEIGLEVWYCAEASATHAVGQSMGTKTEKEQRFAAASFYANARYFESKWFEKIKPDVDTVMVNY